MATSKDANWMLGPTEETMTAIETIYEHNDCADAALRKVFSKALSEPVYEYELGPLGFTLPHRRATMHATLEDGTRRAYEHLDNDLPRIRSPALPFFVLVHAY